MRLLLCTLLIPLGLCGREALESTREIREMDRATASGNYPVRITGVVTFCVPAALGGFVLEKDGTGIWVGLFSTDSAGRTIAWAEEHAGAPPGEAEVKELRVMLRLLRPGMRIEVSGITVPGGYAPSIAATRLRIVAEKETLPPPPALDPSRFLTGTLDCQRVLVEGVVQERLPAMPETSSDHTQFMLAIPGHRFRFTVWSHAPWADARITGARVRAEAVCATRFNERGETVGVFLHSSDFSNWSIVEEPPADPFDAPSIEAGQMLPFRARGPVLTRQKLSGTVSYGDPAGFLILETETRAVRVNTVDAAHFHPGDVVEASGFVELRAGFAELSGASARRTGSRPSPNASEQNLHDLLAAPVNSRSYNPEDHQYRLLRLSGIYRRQESATGGVELHVEDAAGEFTARLARVDDDLRARIAALRPGSKVSLTGVSELRYSSPDTTASTQMRPLTLTLLMRGGDDLRIVRQAPWWTPQRLLIAFTFTATVLALALLWAAQLRRRVAQRSAELAQEIATRQQVQVTFDATLQERKRLAADLHDGMEQTLNGLALQLQAAQRFMGESPERTAHHLDLSLNFLDSSRDELRRSVWDLRSEGLAGKSLPRALQDFIPQWTAGHDTRIDFQTDGDIRAVPDHIASNLLMLVREGVNNALKHARPSQISLRLAFHSAGLVLTLRDDGRGFDPARAPGVADGHFGLQGMRERMARIGGALQIISSPAGGTTITARAPNSPA
jgi:signal transduction histidine kinase